MRQFLILLFLFSSSFGWAEGPTVSQSSVNQPQELWQNWLAETGETFPQVIVTLAHQVDLFKAIWKLDPDARFYGGPARDFAWFIRGELSKAVSPADFHSRLEGLKTRPIRVNEFLARLSDVDVI